MVADQVQFDQELESVWLNDLVDWILEIDKCGVNRERSCRLAEMLNKTHQHIFAHHHFGRLNI